MNNVYTEDQIKYVREQRLICTTREAIAEAFYKKFDLQIDLTTISTYCKNMGYNKKYKNQIFDDELKEQIIEHYEKGYKTAEIAEILNIGRENKITSQQVSNQISHMGIREKTMLPRDIYKNPQDYISHQAMVKDLKSKLEPGDYVEAYSVRWDGSKTNTVKQYKVIGIYEHFVNVMTRGRVISYYWDDIIKLYKNEK